MKLQLMIAVAVGSQGCGGSSKQQQVSHEAASCDEVSCLLVDQQSACCRALPHEPDKLDRKEIEAAISKVVGDADQCASRHHYEGYFVVSIKINADGSVASVGKPPALGGSLDPDLLACISDVMRSARFASTDEGATISYPFEFHAR